MPQIPIIMPQLGESIAEATIVSFLAQAGEQVEADQDIIEVETNKANMNVASPCRGRLEKFVVNLNESYPVGVVLGYVEASKEETVRLGLDTPILGKPAEENGHTQNGNDAKAPADGERRRVRPTIRGLPDRYVS